MDQTYEIDLTIDAKGQKCPMPVLLASRGIKKLEPGQVMLLEATDGGSRSDIPVVGEGHRQRAARGQ